MNDSRKMAIGATKLGFLGGRFMAYKIKYRLV